MLESVRRLVHDHIPSVERLEILLLLFEGRARRWSVEEIEARIRSNPESIRQNVAALVNLELVGADPSLGPLSRYHYEARRPVLDETVAALATEYRTRRVAVVELIYADRRDSVRGFSDAFRIKGHDR